jgi:hypothetical protein
MKTVYLLICLFATAFAACRQAPKPREAGNAPTTPRKTDLPKRPTFLLDPPPAPTENLPEENVEEHELMKPENLPAPDTIDVSTFLGRGSEFLGMIGDDIRRMDVVFLTVNRISGRYEVTGKSKVRDNICDFKGVIEARSVAEEVYFPRGEPSTIDGKIIGEYRFEEDATQPAAGVFEGTFEIFWAYYDDDGNDSVGYADIGLADVWYTTGHTILFDGNWKSYKTGAIKKACWSDYKACFPDDFDRSDGHDLIPDEKYRSAGWGSLIDAFSADSVARAEAEKEFYKNREWWKKHRE